MEDILQIKVAIKALILEVLERCGVEAEVEIEDSLSKGIIFNLASRDSHLLIGRQGAHLHALEVIIRALAQKQLRLPYPFYFSLDVDDYKRKREWYLKETAKAAAEQLGRAGGRVVLEPMLNFERRIIHAYLQEHYPQVRSESVGQEPRRKIVVQLREAS